MNQRFTIHEIDTPGDPRLDPYRDVRDKDLRGREGTFMAESMLVVRRLLRHPDRIESLLLTPDRLEALRPELEACGGAFPVLVAELDHMIEVAGFPIHRGVMALGRRPSPRELAPARAFAPLAGRERLLLLAAEGITNVDNMGALFRNAAAFGADGILLDPSSCDPLYRKAIRVSMGHVLSIPWAIAERWPQDLELVARMLDLRLVAAETGAHALPLHSLPATPRTAVLLGSEARGVSDEARMCCDVTAFVPMADQVPSLNVAVASAIFLYALRPPA